MTLLIKGGGLKQFVLFRQSNMNSDGGEHYKKINTAERMFDSIRISVLETIGMPQNGLVTREYYKIVLYKKVGANSNPEIEKLKSQKRIKLSQNKISSLIFGSFMPACVD